MSFAWLKELIFPRNCLDCEHILTGKEEIFCFDCWGLLEREVSKGCVFKLKGPACSLAKLQPWAYFQGFSAMLVWKWVESYGCKKPLCTALDGDSCKESLFNLELCRAFEKKVRAFPSCNQEIAIGWRANQASSQKQLVLFR